MKLTEEIRIGDILIKDWWLWSQVKIEKENCPECKNGDSIIFRKGRELSKIIRILQKLNYRGISKKIK